MSPRVKSILDRGLFILVACALGACAGSLQAKTAPAGSRYNSNGKVTLHRGQPCTSQIMFDFHPAGSKSTVFLAAGAKDSRKLTDAARAGRRVRVTGVWKRGRDAGCGYVDVKTLVVETSFWNKIWKP
jgi:hypothetical protein